MRVNHGQPVEKIMDKGQPHVGARSEMTRMQKLQLLVENHAGHIRHEVVHVHHSQHLHAQLRHPIPESVVPHAGRREAVDGDGNDLAGAVFLALGAPSVDAGRCEVVSTQDGQSSALAVPGDGDAELLGLVVILGHQLADGGSDLLLRAGVVVARVHVLCLVHLHEGVLDAHLRRQALERVGAVRVQALGDEGVLIMLHPLGAGHGASPHHDDVAAPEPGDLAGRRGHGHETDPVGVLTPPLVVHHERAAVEPLQALGGRGVKVVRDLVAAVRELRLLQQIVPAVLAAAAVLGVRAVVEGVVCRLRELPVADRLAAHGGIHRVQQTLPVVGALDLSPPRADRYVVERMQQRSFARTSCCCCCRRVLVAEDLEL
ncbi:hypothetical protein Mapa_010192 [Marchantia paleacea]|nr:hypothetical protein Mapa_010192 [Marchantia paleacea]